MSKKVYSGLRTGNGCIVWVSFEDDEGDGRKLPPRLDLWNHSPTGFEWGYGGSGPAQLALAILADSLGDDERAVQLHQAFKWAVISKLPREKGWDLTAAQVMDAVLKIEKEREQKQYA
jgi:hypothetical protein